MSNREESGVDDDSLDGEAFDTGIFDADQIVSEFESQGRARVRGQRFRVGLATGRESAGAQDGCGNH